MSAIQQHLDKLKKDMDDAGQFDKPLVRLRDAISRAIDQMDFCSRDGQPQKLCSCCFQKVRDVLIDSYNATNPEAVRREQGEQ